MADREILFEEFAPNTYEEWQARLTKELKDKALEDLAQRSKSENIYVDPFYNRIEENLKQQAIKVQWLLSYRENNSWKIITESSTNPTNEISTVELYNQGANATQELAFALAKGMEVLNSYEEGSIEKLAPTRSFSLCIGNDFFLEIAKFRALRLLWANIVQQYKPHESKSVFTRITAQTSDRVFTEVEPYTNLLRGTTQAMSAIIGGADKVLVKPFNSKIGANDQSKRLAQNIHHILKYEGRLEKVLDAGAGSWYLEKLTETLAQKAWELLQTIEKQGGYNACNEAGWIDAEIEKVNTVRNAAIENGEDIVVGMNKYAQKSEA